MVNEIRGASLFNDIEDKALRIRNRAVVMANELQSGYDKGRVRPRSAAFLIDYFHHIPNEEKKATQDAFLVFAKERGFVVS